MICKSEGIVLRTLRHQDTNLIAVVYTREYGLQRFMLKAFRTARARSRYSYFQPLSIVDLVFTHREHRDLQQVTESRLAVPMLDIQVHPVKLSLGLTVLEVFADTVQETEPQAELYDFLKGVITSLDLAESRMVQIFIWYLLHLTRFLGFLPHDMDPGARFASFEVQSGLFRPSTHTTDEAAGVLRRMLYSKLEPMPAPDGCQQVMFGAETKRLVIRTLFDYYRHHIEGFRYPQTIKVFAEVFGT
ncbi:MAG: DNA repair protein RecO [Bacteroidia bacterium]|nr:DNA repair protein RecO [Bacteroidia bacterium]